ncbi:uncharacterized protein LOC131158798 [Malania oleifera]|uniref:uncharacterized protein LOC131158798 n=1 Tax=Malania oleifera TaxID=397392 RepID=UPI0025AE85C9|nr:uncharacterized protein LOC131158798 [Malania oleifera]XP_057969655.1 uncharacterized protein LOC131158798 [Malania oleifera]
MQNDDSKEIGKGSAAAIPDLEKQGSADDGSLGASADQAAVLTVLVSNEHSCNRVHVSVTPEPSPILSKTLDPNNDTWLPNVASSPRKGHLSRTESSREECRVCQQEKEEDLIELGCQCRGGLAKAHRSCIDTWFHTRGSNKCEICLQVAANVSPPESQPSTNYWAWRVDPAFRGSSIAQEHGRGCFSPLWVAFSILIGGLLLDVLISITLGVSALPVNIIIGVIVVLGLGTALRLALEFCHEWSLRRVVQRVETNVNVNLGYHPAL